MKGKGSLAPRLIVVAMLALGLIGMHHLVVAACHHAVGHAGHSSAVTTHTSHGTPDSGSAPAAPLQAPRDAPDGAPGGLVGAAATCLAILLMIVGLVVPRLVSRLRRVTAPHLLPAVVRVSTRVFEPPDLTFLSVSRT